MLRRQFLLTAPLAAAWQSVAAEQRHWNVFVFNASHMDLGFQDLPAVIIKRLMQIVDQTVALCEATANAAPERRYKSTIEHSVIVDFYQQSRPREQFERLLGCIRRGQIEVGALYTSVHTDLCGHEELARLTAYAGELRQRYGLPVRNAMLNDAAEGYTMGLAQVLARSGVRRICLGQGAKANIKGIEAELPRFFYWTAKDGSRVLVAWTPGLWTYNRYSAAGFRGRKTLAEFESLKDYPYEVMFRHGGKGDVSSADPKLPELMDTYRQQAPEAHISLATMEEFFRVLEERHGAQIPAISGDRANSWADGPISLARETALHRRTQSELVAAEILMTLAGVDDRTAVSDAYKNLQLYSEHTWGSDFDADGPPGHIRTFRHDIFEGKKETIHVPEGEVLGPTSPQLKYFEDSWNAKKAYVFKARDLTGAVLDRALGKLNARAAGSAPSVAVWNTLSWPRTAMVRFEAPAGAIRRLRDRRTGTWVNVQRDGNAWCFAANDVPAFGCSLFDVESGEPAEAERKAGTSMSNGFYDIAMEPQTGTLRSVIDRQSKTELVDASAPYGMGQYIHANMNDFYEGSADKGKSGFGYGPGERYVAVPSAPPVVESGPVFSAITVSGKLTEGPAPADVRLRVVLDHARKQVRLEYNVNKRAAMEKEQVYLAFPFAAGPDPRFQLELAYATLEWPRDILPGTWRGYASVRNWVRIGGRQANITWSALDTPVVSVGGIHSNQWDPQWHRTYVPQNGHVYSYVMSNIWNCNFPLWQGGESRFDYAFTSGGADEDLLSSVRFGWESQTPLVARWVPAGSGGAAPAAALEVHPANVLATAMKPAYDGAGVIVRLFESCGKAAQVELRPAFRRFQAARKANLVEEDEGPLEIRGGTVRFEMKPYELATIRLL